MNVRSCEMKLSQTFDIYKIDFVMNEMMSKRWRQKEREREGGRLFLMHTLSNHLNFDPILIVQIFGITSVCWFEGRVEIPTASVQAWKMTCTSNQQNIFFLSKHKFRKNFANYRKRYTLPQSSNPTASLKLNPDYLPGR